MVLELDYQECIPENALTALERIHGATVGSETLDNFLLRVLDDILEIFDCDRAWFIYPCRLDTKQVSIALERNKPQWPGAGELNLAIPITDDIRAFLEVCLKSSDPVRFDPLSDPFVDTAFELFDTFNIRSQLVMALHPKGDDPWILGIHHCTQAHVYENAVPLFRAIGNRVATAIGAQITMRGLRQSEERFRTLIEHAPEAITMLDVDTGLYVDANPMAEVLHGLPRDKMIGKIGPADLSPKFQLDGSLSTVAATAYLKQALAGEFPKFEWLHLTPDGKETITEVCLARLPDPRRKLVRASISDITERKAIEEKHAELEAKLAQSQKLDAVGQLTGGVAHDFNNLLGIILGNAELVKNTISQDEKASKWINTIIETVDRGASLAHRLLAFSRKQDLLPLISNIDDLIGGLEDMLQRTLGETIVLRHIDNPNLWSATIDQHQFENVVVNLAINGRDAMPDGGKLTIETTNITLDKIYAEQQEEVKPGDYVKVAVSDTGTGMTPEVREKLFEPFFTTKEIGKGSGLGLSMVYGFVKQSGGHISIFSEVDRGTTVTLYLPRSQESDNLEENPAKPPAFTSGSGRILVVEDDEELMKIPVTVLSEQGYEVTEARDGPEAISHLEQGPPFDLLFCDMVLPGGMNGVDIAREAKRLQPQVKVIFTTGYAEHAVLDQVRLEDDTTIFAKPYNLTSLLEKIQETLAGNSR